MNPSAFNNQTQHHIELIDALYKDNLITRPSRNLALEHAGLTRTWDLWASRLLLWFGVAFVLAGIVFFFAFNWNKLSPFLKLSLIQAGLISSTLLSVYFDRNRTLSIVFAMASALLVGVFFAVFGQIYQTGANSFALFLVWSLCLLPWVFLYNATPLWCLFFIVSETGIILWWSQTIPHNESNMNYICLILTAVNFALYLMREKLLSSRLTFLRESWMRYVLVFFSLAFSTLPILIFILDRASLHQASTISFIIYGVLWLSLFAYHRIYKSDQIVLALLLLNTCVVIETWLIRELILSKTQLGDSANILLIAILTLLLFYGGFLFYRHIIQSQGDSTRDT